MNRTVQGIVLVLFGGVVARVVLADLHLNYVKPGMGPALLAAAAVLVGLGGLALWESLREDPQSPATAHEAHGHAGHGPRAAWGLLLPVAAVLVVPAAPLGAFTAERMPAIAPVASSAAVFPPLVGDPADLSVGDFVSRAIWDDGRTLAGQRVRLVGFVSPDEAGGWQLTRLGLACCAADAYVLKVRAEGAPELPADTWVEVVGVWQPGGDTGVQGAIPRLAVESAVPTAAPANPYDS
ncbi:MAG: TIGR03943 family protein [Candidatus Nanopelagicales bacterium]|nr:TIGR03943 family protein [Candidatus Nanopelagicales bacterium]